MNTMLGHPRGGHRGGIGRSRVSRGAPQATVSSSPTALVPPRCRGLLRGGTGLPSSVDMRAVGMALAVLMAAGGCTATPSVPAPSTPAAPTVTSVSVPPATDSGPVITVDAEVRWVVGHPGCSLMRVGPDTAAQTFQLTGPHAQLLRHEAERGQRPVVERVRICGYVAVSADQTTVCGASRPFVVTEAR